MARSKRMAKRTDKKVYKASAVRTKAINRAGANAHGGIRF